MILGTSHSPGRGRAFFARGFSLLEIVFVLGLIAVIVTWITVSVNTVQTEEQLRRVSGGVVSMATQARNISVRQQRPYTVTITKEQVSLGPRYPADSDEEDSESEVKTHEDITAVKDHDEAVTIEIQRWASDDWVLLEKDKKVVFNVDPTGLVEPIGIRCSINESWLIQRLHPLTAAISDEEMTIKKD